MASWSYDKLGILSKTEMEDVETEIKELKTFETEKVEKSVSCQKIMENGKYILMKP